MTCKLWMNGYIADQLAGRGIEVHVHSGTVAGGPDRAEDGEGEEEEEAEAEAAAAAAQVNARRKSEEFQDGTSDFAGRPSRRQRGDHHRDGPDRRYRCERVQLGGHSPAEISTTQDG